MTIKALKKKKARNLIKFIVPIVLFSGCASKIQEFAVTDFQIASEYGKQARINGLLAVTDRWPECFEQIARDINQLESPKNLGFAQLAMKTHIAANKPPLSAECSQVAWELTKKTIKVGANAIPGGGFLGWLKMLWPF